MKKEQMISIRVSCLILMLLFGIAVQISTVRFTVSASPTTWNVYAGESIQAAIDGASAGDTIIVHNTTTYSEALYIDKTLTIKAVDTPTIQGKASFMTNYIGSPWTRSATIFVVNATNVIIDGFTVKGVGPSQDVIVYVYSSGQIKNCHISGNTAEDMYSIDVEARASDLTINKCTIDGFGRIGVYMANCTGGVYSSTIIGQVYGDEGLVNYGIEIENHQGVRGNLEIIGNTIYNCDNTFSPEPLWSSAAIIIDTWSEYEGPYPSSTVNMTCNNIYDNYLGIEICKNALSFAHYNNIYNNRYGVVSTPDYLNVNATFDARYNWWGSTTGPYHTTLNPTGLGNEVSDNVAFNPWLQTIKIPPLFHDITIFKLTATPEMLLAGQIVNINVTVKNVGNMFETFNLGTTYGTFNPQTKVETITDLAPGDTRTFYYQWDTTGEHTGVHNATAIAGPVYGEIYLFDNIKIAYVRIVSFIPAATTLKLVPSTLKGLQHGHINVNVTINDLDAYWDLAGFDIKIAYNTTMLDAIQLTLGDFSKKFNLTFEVLTEINDAEGYVEMVYLWDIRYPETRLHPFGSGTLFTIQFLATQTGQDDIKFEYVSLAAFPNATKWYTDLSEPITCTTENGVVHIGIPILEDVNADGKVDILDVVIAAAAYASRPGNPNWNPYADLDGDGKITILDLVRITVRYGYKYDP